MMKRFYCTYFDRNYLVRGLALINSLRKNSEGDWQLFVVCMDHQSRNMLERFAMPNVVTFSIEQIEGADPELVAAKNDRNRTEYLWTTTPAIILWLIKNNPEIDTLTYLDADLYFYSSPEPIFAEMKESSVLIHEHRYSPELRDMEINGKYNVGLLCFRNDEAGARALRWWRERCIESCHHDLKAGKCGDQVYLNDWPTRFTGVRVLQHRGAAVAPWNVDQFSLRVENSRILIEDVPLIFYHFHGLRILGPECFRLAYRFYIRSDVARLIYQPYTRELTAAMDDILRVDHTFRFAFQQLQPIEKVWDFLFRFRPVSQLIAAVRRWTRRHAPPWTVATSS